MRSWGGEKITKYKLAKHFDIKKLQFVVDNILNDEYSKNLYLSAVINWISNNKGIFITLYYDHIWKYYKYINTAKCDDKIIANGQELFLYNLSKVNLADLKIYYSQLGIFVDFILEQYAYRDIIRAKAGDYVIDGGACYGDTALYFSNLVGENGKVFAFEFVNENIEIFNKNMEINSNINNIELVKRPLHSNSNTIVSYNGVGGVATMNVNTQQKQSFKTISIDDFVEENNIPKIDFIKFDIEGSELSALKGAEKTIKKHKPQLAICLYHSFRDYTEIPVFLHKLVPEYEFYFDHFTLSLIESVLFARLK